MVQKKERKKKEEKIKNKNKKNIEMKENGLSNDFYS